MTDQDEKLSNNVLAEVALRQIGKGSEPRLIHNCTTCNFHDTQPLAMPDGRPVIGKSQTICRRFPPTVVPIQVPTPQGISVQLMPMFPPVNGDMWCYEHEPENGAEDIG